MTEIRSRLDTLYQMFNLTGLRGIAAYEPVIKPFASMVSKLGVDFQNKFLKLSLKGYESPAWLRYGSSDRLVFKQIFLQEEYAALKDLDDPKLIVDCGANVGYSSLYFLNQYPNTTIIAVEPDPENFKVCERNLAPYQDRVSLMQSAIWSHPAQLRSNFSKGPGNEWAVRVKECRPGEESNLVSTDIATLLENSDFETIDLLKIDVEGAEAVIFSHNFDTWLKKVKNIVIELHGKACENAFFQALSAYNYERSKQGELTICRSIAPKS